MVAPICADMGESARASSLERDDGGTGHSSMLCPHIIVPLDAGF